MVQETLTKECFFGEAHWFQKGFVVIICITAERERAGWHTRSNLCKQISAYEHSESVITGSGF